jgi:uncharacterized protein DUF5343
MESEKKLPTPPYVAYKTFRNFLDKFKQGVPGRIDRDLMGSMSGAAQSQVTTALKFLGFISENNLPLDSMKRFVAAEAEDRRVALEAILHKAYPYLFGDGFNLSSATASQLRETIEANTGATGETVNRCIAFFKDAAQDAGINVSKYITQKKPRMVGAKKRNGSGKSGDGEAGKIAPPPPVDQYQPQRIEAQNSMLLWGLFQRLPKPGSVWPKQQRDQWTETLNNVLALEYKEQ